MAEMTTREMGRLGQELAREIIQRAEDTKEFCQLDWVVKKKDIGWYSVEVKNQEYFHAPPFDGHGLPIWQVRTRIRLYEETGLRPLLMIFDPDKQKVYWQWLDVLEQLDEDEKFDTQHSDRRIYPLTRYEEYGNLHEISNGEYRIIPSKANQSPFTVSYRTESTAPTSD